MGEGGREGRRQGGREGEKEIIFSISSSHSYFIYTGMSTITPDCGINK